MRLNTHDQRLFTIQTGRGFVESRSLNDFAHFGASFMEFIRMTNDTKLDPEMEKLVAEVKEAIDFELADLEDEYEFVVLSDAPMWKEMAAELVAAQMFYRLYC